MLTREVKHVQDNNIPLVICGGTVEYHGTHCSYGCDTLVAEGLVKKLAEKKGIMIATTIFCGRDHSDLRRFLCF